MRLNLIAELSPYPRPSRTLITPLITLTKITKTFLRSKSLWTLGKKLTRRFICSTATLFIENRTWVNLIMKGTTRHFSHMTKSCIFKILNLTKSWLQPLQKLQKKHIWHWNLYSNPQSWLAGSCYSKGTFSKKQRLK